jgi:hypothetical protein
MLSISTPLFLTPASELATVLDPGPKHAAINLKHASMFSTLALALELAIVLDSSLEHAIVDVNQVITVVNLKPTIVDLTTVIPLSVSSVRPPLDCEFL